MTTEARIGHGDGVLVVGRLRAASIQATGPESLLVVGGPGDARSTLARLRGVWRGMWFLLIGLAMGA